MAIKPPWSESIIVAETTPRRDGGAFVRCRRPALLHSLWLLVRLKLITPPFLPLSFTWPRAGFQGLRDLVFAVAFSKDGRTLAAASKDQNACLWQVPSRRPLPAGAGSVRGRGEPIPPP